MRRIGLLVLFMASAHAFAGDERDDFGLRIEGGGISGIADTVIPDASVWADFYFLSPDVRMLFGFTIMDANDDRIPLAALQAIGAEFNWPWRRQRFLFGMRFNKTYLRENSELLKPKRGMSFHLGYKYRIVEHQDVVVEMGQQYQPFEMKRADSLILDDKTFFARVGWEIYF